MYSVTILIPCLVKSFSTFTFKSFILRGKTKYITQQGLYILMYSIVYVFFRKTKKIYLVHTLCWSVHIMVEESKLILVKLSLLLFLWHNRVLYPYLCTRHIQKYSTLKFSHPISACLLHYTYVMYIVHEVCVPYQCLLWLLCNSVVICFALQSRTCQHIRCICVSPIFSLYLFSHASVSLHP